MLVSFFSYVDAEAERRKAESMIDFLFDLPYHYRRWKNSKMTNEELWRKYYV